MENGKSKAIQYGLIGAFIGIAYGLIAYLTGTQLYTKWVIATVIGLLMLGVYIYLMTASSKAFRKANGGHATFGQAFKEAFIPALVWTAAGLLFNILLFHVIDTGYGDQVMNAIADMAEGQMEKGGMSEANIEKRLDKMAANDRFSIGGLVKSNGIGLIFSAVIAAIIGAIVKKKKPEIIDGI